MSEFFSPLYDNDLDTRSNSLITNELLVKDPLTDEYKPIIPNEGGGGAVRPYYTTDTEIDFGIDKTKITQSQISLGGPSVSAMKKTILKSGELDVTDDAGNNAKIAGGAIYYKKASLEGEEENPTVTMPYEDIGEVVDKIKPIDYLNSGNINFSDKGLSYRIILSETSSNTGLQMKSDLLQIGPKGSAVSGIRAYLRRDSLKFTSATTGDWSEYRNKEIRISDPLDGERTLNLEDLLTSQENYLKPDKIEFADGTGLSQGLLHYVDDEANVNDVIDVTNKFKDVTAAVGTINGIHNKFGGAGANPAFNSTNIQTSLLKIMAITADAADINTVTNNLKDLESTAAQIDAAVANSGTTYDYLTNDGIRTTGTQSITHKINSSDSLNRYSLTSYSTHHQSKVTVGNNSSSGRRIDIQPDRIYLYEESGEFSGFYNDHIRYVKGGEVKSLVYDDVNKTIDKVNTGYIKTSFWSSRSTSKIFWIGKYEKALEATHSFPSSSIIQFTEHAVRNSGKILFRMWYNANGPYSAGEIIKFIFRVQKPTTTPEGPSLANKYAMITAHICDVPRNAFATQYLGALVEVVSVGPSLHGEDVEDNPGISFENEYYAYYTLRLRALKSIAVGELDFTMMFQFHGYLGDFGTMPTSMYVT